MAAGQLVGLAAGLLAGLVGELPVAVPLVETRTGLDRPGRRGAGTLVPIDGVALVREVLPFAGAPDAVACSPGWPDVLLRTRVQTEFMPSGLPLSDRRMRWPRARLTNTTPCRLVCRPTASWLPTITAPPLPGASPREWRSRNEMAGCCEVVLEFSVVLSSKTNYD